MNYTLSQKSSNTEIATIIESVWIAETTRDIDGAVCAFLPIWDDIDSDPNFDCFDLLDQAELYRLSGYFLSYSGKARNLKDFQERGKNLICRSITLYERLGDELKIANAQNALALCYYYEGAVLEAELILEQTAVEFLGDHLELTYFQNRNNLLLTKFAQRKHKEAIEIINEIEIPIEFCGENRTCFVFHEKAGLIYRGVKQYEKAVFHYQEAIKFASKDNNLLFVSSIKNNLAFLNYKLNNYELAHQYSNEAIYIAQKDNFIGWLPTYLDTKALIFAGEGHLELALEVIEKALAILLKSDDYYSIADSMWNRCKFLFQLNRSEEAIIQFGELINVAREKMGEFAVKNFSKEFSNLIYVKQEGSLTDEIARFKRLEIVHSIKDNNYSLQMAADSLKIDISELQEILDNEFPEIYVELDLQPIEKKSVDLFENHKNSHSAPHKILPLHLQNVSLSNANCQASGFSTFYLSGDTTQDVLGIKNDSVIAVTPLDKLKTDDFLLIYCPENDEYSLGKCLYDKDLDIYYLNTGKEPKPLSLNKIEIIGRAVEYLPFSEIDNELLLFSPLNF